MAPSAWAAAEVGGTAIASASAHPTLLTGIANQPAGDLNLAALPAVASGDFITISVDDNDVAANCATANDTVLFATTPTVTTSTGAAIALTPSLVNVGASCTGANKDGVRLTASAAIPAGALVKVSGIRYSVGSDAATGPVQLAIGATPLSTTNANAVLSAVSVSSSSPATLLAPSTANQAIPSVTFSERRAGAITAGGACVSITAPAGTTFHTTPTPTVVATVGNGVPGAVTVTTTSVSFVVTTPSTGTGATNYTVSGLHLDTGATTGPVDARAGSTCPANDFAQQLRLASIGTVDRLAGSDRYATAEQIADNGGCVTPGHPVVIARGDNFPDALAASFLAGRNGVPILLTAPTSVPNETLAALKNIGADSVILIGGNDAISVGVATLFANTPAYNCHGIATVGHNISVDRAFGADRYATARSVALRGATAGTADNGLTDDNSCSAVPTAIVASGENFPDALAAGPLAYTGFHGCGSGALPLLLTHATSLPSDTANTITDMGIKQVILLGGTTAVSTGVSDAIDALSGVSVKRISGPDRQGTAVQISKLESSQLGGFELSRVFLARGDTFPDALAAGPLAGALHAPIFLSQSTTALGTTTADGITGYANGKGFVDHATLLGGTAALTDTVGSQVGTAIASQPTPS